MKQINYNAVTGEITEIEVPDIIIPQPILNYDTEVIRQIRERYSINDELAILRQRDEKPEEFNTYSSYCEDVKSRVKNMINS